MEEKKDFNLDKLSKWKPPREWNQFTTIDTHTEGEPLRIILSGFPRLTGSTILEKRNYAKKNYDQLRKALMWEPRGHADMYGCIITPPVSVGSDFGVIFMHNEGFSTMCGHGILSLTKVAVETGLVAAAEPETKVKIDTPAGLINSYANVSKGKVEHVYFHNVPSFVLTSDRSVKVKGIGIVNFDIAFGGAFYAFVNASQINLDLTPDNYPKIIDWGMRIKRAVIQSSTIKHPFEEDLNFLYGTIFISPPINHDADSRNVCIFAEGEVDRSPTGTGVSARMALHYAKGEIKMNERMVIESIIGTKFTGSVIKTTKFGPYNAVIPRIEGTAHITGMNRFYIDPADPLSNGFILR